MAKHPDEVIDPQYEAQMVHLARTIDRIFNGDPGPERVKKTGFFLCVFPFDNFDGRSNYVSNANRKDIIVLLKEMAARFQGQPEVEGRA